jgi:chromosome segregation ATPase
MGRLLERGNRGTFALLQSIAADFGWERPEWCMRSVIVTVVIANRIAKAKLSSESTFDPRYWSWFSNNQFGILQNTMKEKLETLQSLQEQKEEANAEVLSLKERLNEVHLESGDRINRLIELENSNLFLRGEMAKLNDELSSLIDPQTYDSVRAELQAKIRALKAASKQIKLLTEEKAEAVERLEEAKIALQDQQFEKNMLREEYEVVQTQIENLGEELKLVKRYQATRTKEFLALERGVMTEKVNNDRQAAQCMILVEANKKLSNCMNPVRDGGESPVVDCGSFLGVRTVKTLL